MHLRDESDDTAESKYCLLLNESGRRFADETTGDEIVNQYLAKQEGRRGFILFKYANHPMRHDLEHEAETYLY